MQADAQDITRRLDLAVKAARQAGNITLEYFRTDDLVVNLKQDNTPVTIADHEVEEYLRNTISSAFPDDGILGEEFAEQKGGSGYRWIIDPIDGTKSFIHGVPLYGTLLGVEYGGQCVLGVIRIPALDECLYAAKGQGAWYFVGHNQPKPARVSQRKPLAKALFVTSEVITFDRAGRRAAYDRLQAATRLTAHLGRLLRVSDGSHRPCGPDGRSGNGPLGRRSLVADSRRSGRNLHRLARAEHHLHRRRNSHQRFNPFRGA